MLMFGIISVVNLHKLPVVCWDGTAIVSDVGGHPACLCYPIALCGVGSQGAPFCVV